MKKSSTSPPCSRYKSIVEGLQDIYRKKIMPFEVMSNYEGFYGPLLSPSELVSKPMVLLLGQYSTGKTSFIRTCLGGKEYPGAHIGPEPTTDRFVAVMEGVDERVIPGNAAACQTDKPFKTLSQFGASFLNKFQISTMPSSILASLTFIDSPGVLSGEKQRLGRSYDFVHVCEWFAEKSDLILLLFDAHKLDISDEFKRVIGTLKGHDDKIRIVLNKADAISTQQLMRVYGALMWSLGKAISTPEVMRVYIGSFCEEPSSSNAEDRSSPTQTTLVGGHNKDLLKAEMDDLYRDLGGLQKASNLRKINDLVKRTRRTRVHLHILSALRREMPSVFGKASKQTTLVSRLPDIFTKVQKETHLPPGDFPDIDKFKAVLETLDFTKFPKLEGKKALKDLEDALEVDLPALMRDFPSGPTITPAPVLNPFMAPGQSPTLTARSFSGVGGHISSSGSAATTQAVVDSHDTTFLHGNGLYDGLTEEQIPWAWSSVDHARYERIFHSLSPIPNPSAPPALSTSLYSSSFDSSHQSTGVSNTNLILTGPVAKSAFIESGLLAHELAMIWKWADIASRDGVLDLWEFCIAMRCIEIRLCGGPIPSQLPAAFRPPPAY